MHYIIFRTINKHFDDTAPAVKSYRCLMAERQKLDMSVVASLN